MKKELKMLKTRLLLIVLILGIMVGGTVLWTSNFDHVWKLLGTVGGGFLYISAIILFAVTFFALDENGCIPQNTLVYWYFSNFYKVREKNSDGKEIEVVKMPEYLKLCLMFWMVVSGVFLVSFVIAYLLGFIYLVGYGVYYGITVGYDVKSIIQLFLILGFIAAIAGFFILAIFLASRKNSLLHTLGLLMLVGFFVALFWGLPTYSYIERGMSFAQAGTKAAVDLGVGLGWFIGIILGIVLFVALVVWLAYRIFPWVKNSVIGKLLSALYNNLCPMIPVENSSTEIGTTTL